ncbi:MAG: UvrD-helicase domain-containing protein [Flavobacteriaceae bacterium]|nr:UvrD-helicase domain-containing protein [Flavobacteriaceae bacterium]MCY4266389.1 UvrD-helicase domain-containing protein [Flavobacteriaceae bacterium]
MNHSQINQLLSELNSAQQQAVLNLDGPTLIVAGAGSGKTRVITYRVAHLFLKQVSPSNILALTFTNKAAQVMKERIVGLTHQNQSRHLWAGTFHSIFARLLRFEHMHTPYPQNFTIYDASDSLSVIRVIIKEMNLSNKAYNPRQVLSRISRFKNELITAENYQNQEDLILQDSYRLQPEFAKIYLRYHNKCILSGALDFDDLLLQTYLLLKHNAEVLQKYQSRFRYILVDEYQDINEVQHQVVNILGDKFENVCVVGDDAQSIYAFRGAKIKYIQEFRKRYPEALTYRLEQNYRSTKNIIGVANSIIKHNKKQIKKTLYTENEVGHKVCVLEHYNEIAEATFVKDEIIKITNKDDSTSGVLSPKIASYNQICVLYRTNAQSRVFEEILGKSKIPYRIYGNISFYARSEVKDVLAYLKFIINPDDRESFKRIISKPTRGIGPTSVDKIIVFADQHKLNIMDAIKQIIRAPFGISQSIINRFDDFKSMIDRFRVELKNMNAAQIAKLVVERTGIIDFVKKRSESDEIANEKESNINELLNSVSDFINQVSEADQQDNQRTENMSDFIDRLSQERQQNSQQKDNVNNLTDPLSQDIQQNHLSLGAYLQMVSLYTSQDQQNENKERITLMTVHLSKGLEFPCVFVVGLEQDLFPSALNDTPEGIEEERRLMYVATTRAEKLLYLTHAISRFKAGERMTCFPSQFLSEIDENFIFQSSKTNFTTKFNSFKLKPKKTIEYVPSKISTTMEPKKLKKVDDDFNGKEHYPDLKVGSKINHKSFGLGIVESIEGSGQNKKAVIQFEKIQTTKKLLLAYAKIKILRTKS